MLELRYVARRVIVSLMSHTYMLVHVIIRKSDSNIYYQPACMASARHCGNTTLLSVVTLCVKHHVLCNWILKNYSLHS